MGVRKRVSMESAVSFALLRPADFVNFAGRAKAGFSRDGAGRAPLITAETGLLNLP